MSKKLPELFFLSSHGLKPAASPKASLANRQFQVPIHVAWNAAFNQCDLLLGHGRIMMRDWVLLLVKSLLQLNKRASQSVQGFLGGCKGSPENGLAPLPQGRS